MEQKYPPLLLTKNGNKRALPRHYIAVAIMRAMKAVKAGENKLKT